MSKFDIVRPPDCSNYNQSYARNFSLILKKDIMNIELDLISPLITGLRVHLDFYTRKDDFKTYQSFYQYSFDLCSMMGNHKNNMFKRWFISFFSFGNFKSYCPIPPDHYYLGKYNVNNLLIPTFLFTGSYRLSFNIFQHKKLEKDFVLGCNVEVKIK
ncbi:hypothetical protein KR215_004831 [Drosophila sulfurigaster]|nr:hypothetical protein KR215_004831 [Drosophila sulfurigaster]